MKSLQFNLQIACDNAAFEVSPATELARILRDTAQRLELGCNVDGKGDGLWIRDTNGNTVGTAKLRTVRKS